MVIHVAKTSLLIAHRWKIVQIVKDPIVGNIDKCWMCTLPGFDDKLFPFVVISGYMSFNILNVKTGFM